MDTVFTPAGDFKPVAHGNCTTFSTSGVSFTVLPDMFAQWKRFIQVENIGRFAAYCSGTIRPSKSDLPLVFMGKLGREPSAKGCLRYAGNVEALTGCCGDYDGPRLGAIQLPIDTIEAPPGRRPRMRDLRNPQLDLHSTALPHLVPGIRRVSRRTT